MTVRRATLDDIAQMVALGKKMHSEITLEMGALCEERVAKTMSALTTHGFAAVAEKNNMLVGFAIGDVFTPWYSPMTERMGTDYAIYIVPEHRNGYLAMKMIKLFEAWCWENGAQVIRPGVGTGSEGAVKLLEHLGYKAVGKSFYKSKEMADV